jgi:hypothetical protein
VLVHVVDVSGTTNEKGEETAGYNPLQDVQWLQDEIELSAFISFFRVLKSEFFVFKMDPWKFDEKLAVRGSETYFDSYDLMKKSNGFLSIQNSRWQNG